MHVFFLAFRFYLLCSCIDTIFGLRPSPAHQLGDGTKRDLRVPDLIVGPAVRFQMDDPAFALSSLERPRSPISPEFDDLDVLRDQSFPFLDLGDQGRLVEPLEIG